MRSGATKRTAALLAFSASFGARSQAAVGGRVVSAEGAPIANATVEAFAPESAAAVGLRRVAGQGPTPLVTVKSGTDGTFRLDTKGAISWVQATSDGYGPAVATPDGDTALQLTLKPAASRRGVITSRGQPVAGAVVVWSTPNGGERLSRSDAQGAFEAPEPDTVPGQVVVFHPDFAPESTYVGMERGRGLDQKLEPGLPLAGRAVDASGRAVEGASVWVDGWPVARTDAKGSFTIPHAPTSWSSVTVRAPGTIGVVGRKVGPLLVTTKPERTLSGLVTDAATRLPVAGAVVVVATTTGSESAETDVKGRYTLGGLPPGRYRPYAGRVGYVSGPADHESAQPIDLRSAAAGRFDVAIARLPAVRGRVVDERGRPVEGALVSLGFTDTPNVYASNPWSALHMSNADAVVTASDGTFRMRLPGDDAESAHFLTANRPIVVLKRGHAAAQAAFEKGRTAPVVITLPRGIALFGTVTGADGTPLGGVAVTAAEDGAMGGSLLPTHMMLPRAQPGPWVVSDDQGRFEMRVNPAVHHLYFRKSGYAPRLARGHDPRGAGALAVTLEPAAHVRGRVSRADGRGVADVQVAVSAPSGAGGETAVTAADGTFEVRDLAPGDYQVVARHDDLGLNQTRSVQAPVADLQIVLAPAVTVRGTVLDGATRQPVPRFNVVVEADQTGEATWRHAEITDGSGEFAVEDVPAGQASLTVTADGYAERKLEGLELEPDLEPAAVELLLDGDAPIRGRVTGPSGEAIAEAEVSIDGKGSSTVSVDEDGEYEVRGLAPGEVKIGFAADGYLSEQRTIDSRQTKHLDVTLKRGLTLTGMVLHAGTGVAGAYVGAKSSATGASHESAQTDERGRFSLAGLVAGRYTLTAQATGKGSAKLEDVDAESAGPLRLTLDKAGTAVITGRVVGLPAGDLGMAMVMAHSQETSESSQAALDSARAFRMPDAPAGRVTVRAFAASPEEGSTRTSRAVELVLAPGSETETVIEFPDDVTISGVVTREGAGVPHAQVSFGNEIGQGAMARTDARGAYQAVGLEPGRYDVNVMGDRVSYATRYTVTASAEFDIDVTGGALAGRVVSADGGAPLGDVVISLFRLGEGENAPESSVTTGSQGSFVQRNLREGRLRLVTSKKGFGQEVRDVEIASGATADVQLELAPAEGVGVTVVDARDQRPLEAIVVVRDQARRIVANRHSGADENGALNIPLASGSYLLSTSATGYGTVTAPVMAPAQGLRIGLTPGGTLVIESARELRGRVRLVQPGGEEYVRCWCNGIAEIQLNGRRTSVENVTPGSYTMEIVDAPDGVKPRPVVVREGQTSTVTIE